MTIDPHHVEPGGPVLTAVLADGLTMIKFSVGPMDNNAYLISAGPHAVLIDAANDPDRLLEVVGATGPETVITTHQHGDHWQGLAAVVAARQPRLLAGRPDVEAIERGAGVNGITGVWDGDEIELGGYRLTVIGLVGHTPGSIALALTTGGGNAGESRTHLFTGDALFPGGPGKTRSTADFTNLVDDLETKIFGAFTDDTLVHPGHGDSTTLGAERPNLAHWRARGW